MLLNICLMQSNEHSNNCIISIKYIILCGNILMDINHRDFIIL